MELSCSSARSLRLGSKDEESGVGNSEGLLRIGILSESGEPKHIINWGLPADGCWLNLDREYHLFTAFTDHHFALGNPLDTTSWRPGQTFLQR
jgi:hypothetical protein